jgi:hypothetical protein
MGNGGSSWFANLIWIAKSSPRVLFHLSNFQTFGFALLLLACLLALLLFLGPIRIRSFSDTHGGSTTLVWMGVVVAVGRSGGSGLITTEPQDINGRTQTCCSRDGRVTSSWSEVEGSRGARCALQHSISFYKI